MHTVQASEMDPVTQRLIHLTRWLRYQIDPKHGAIEADQPRADGSAKGSGKSRNGSRR